MELKIGNKYFCKSFDIAVKLIDINKDYIYGCCVEFLDAYGVVNRGYVNALDLFEIRTIPDYRIDKT